jgi:hypothetical protein
MNHVTIAHDELLVADPLRLAYLGSSDVRVAERRLVRTPTLDGDVAYNDGGFIDGDRTLRFEFSVLTDAQAQGLRTLAEAGGRVRVGVDGRSYLGIISRYSFSSSGFFLSVEVVRRLDQ